jgi:hypothetical protein
MDKKEFRKKTQNKSKAIQMLVATASYDVKSCIRCIKQ